MYKHPLPPIGSRLVVTMIPLEEGTGPQKGDPTEFQATVMSVVHDVDEDGTLFISDINLLWPNPDPAVLNRWLREGWRPRGEPFPRELKFRVSYGAPSHTLNYYGDLIVDGRSLEAVHLDPATSRTAMLMDD